LQRLRHGSPLMEIHTRQLLMVEFFGLWMGTQLALATPIREK